MARKKNITVQDLLQIERLGAPSLSPDGAQAVTSLSRFSMDDNKSRSALWLLSSLGGEPRALTQCGDKDGAPRWSPRGDLIAFTAKREQEGQKDEEAQLYLIAPDGGEARRAASVATGVEGFRWAPGGRQLVFVSWVWPELKGTAAQARKHKEFKARKETGYVTSEAQYRFWDHNLPMGRVAHLHLLTLGKDGVEGSVRDLFEGTPYELARTSPDARHFDIAPDGKRLVFAFDPAGEKRVDGRFSLAEMDLRTRRVEERWIKGAAALEGGERDEVQMWVVYPPGFDPKKNPKKTYPVMHNIHGGPHTAAGDNWHYRWNTQVFAAQGYVVACVNYHGSSSFGYAFKDSITHRWGALELQDIEAGTDWLLKQRWCDKQRIFATGGSYGGYMVAWMNAHVKAGRYAAYVCHAGCFDWTAMFADDAYTWHAKELGAWYWDDLALVQSQSPHVYAQTMATPTLIIHGALDYRVPDAQGLAYYNTLKAQGVDARLLWFPDENHWVLKPRNSQLWYAEFFAWLQRHGKPMPKPTPARRGASQAG